MLSSFNIPSPLQLVKHPLLDEKKISLYLKRDDLIHTEITGNKWRKMKYNVEVFRKSGKEGILSFGGAYSNHLRALAALGRELHIPTTALVRGLEPTKLTHTMLFTKACGMQLISVKRSQYANRNQEAGLDDWLREMGVDSTKYFILPEGGSNKYALDGCAEIIKEINKQINIPFDAIAVAMGTGATLAGIAMGMKGTNQTDANAKQIIGFSVLKNGAFLKEEVLRFWRCADVSPVPYQLNTDYDFGGYAKRATLLDEFILSFYQLTKVKLDYVYNGKMMYGLMDMIAKDAFPQGAVVVAIITGGLQNASIWHDFS